MINKQAPEWLLLTRWSSYLDREAQTLEDSGGQSVPHQSCHYPYSTWMLAGSLLPGCNRENLHHYIMKSKWKSDAQADIVLLFIDLHMLPFSSDLICGGGFSWSMRNLPRVILNAAQGQTEGHVPAQLFRGSHESLQIVLQTVAQGDEGRVKTLTGTTLDLSFCFCCLWLTMKYWMISGLLLDFSSTSVNTSNTSIVNNIFFNACLIQDLHVKMLLVRQSVTLHCLSSWDLF